MQKRVKILGGDQQQLLAPGIGGVFQGDRGSNLLRRSP
jgi:hypothetical protein